MSPHFNFPGVFFLKTFDAKHQTENYVMSVLSQHRSKLYSITIIQYYNYTVLQLYSITIIQYYNYTVLQLYSITIVQYYNYTVLQLYSPVLRSHLCTVLQLYSPVLRSHLWSNEKVVF